MGGQVENCWTAPERGHQVAASGALAQEGLRLIASGLPDLAGTVDFGGGAGQPGQFVGWGIGGEMARGEAL